MYEAADGAVRALLKHCRAHLLLKQLTVPIINDRSAKLRLCCATYLLQVGRSNLTGPRSVQWQLV
jgi:hypothetical protein